MKRLVLILLLMVSICSCGYHEGVVQKAESSFLMFTGNVKNVSVQIDDAEPLVLKSGSEKKLYQLLPGKHRLKVYRGGNLVIDRLLFLEDQVTTEVRIP